MFGLLRAVDKIVSFPAWAGRTYLVENRDYENALQALAVLYARPVSEIRVAFRARCAGSSLHWRKVYLLVTRRYDLRFLMLLGMLLPERTML